MESHNSLREVERYHAFPRNIYERVRYEHPGQDDETVLQLATKVCNDTARSSGLVPTLLVFVVMPRIFVNSRELPAQKEKLEALHTAQKEILKLIFRMLLQTSARTNVPASADNLIFIEDNLLVYRD